MCGQMGNLPFSDRLPPVSPVDTGGLRACLQPGSSGLERASTQGQQLTQSFLAQKTANPAEHLGPAHTCTE